MHVEFKILPFTLSFILLLIFLFFIFLLILFFFFLLILHFILLLLLLSSFSSLSSSFLLFQPHPFIFSFFSCPPLLPPVLLTLPYLHELQASISARDNHNNIVFLGIGRRQGDYGGEFDWTEEEILLGGLVEVAVGVVVDQVYVCVVDAAGG